MKIRRRLLGVMTLSLLLLPIWLPAASGPQLVVVIVIDQFRPDYLTRFSSHFLPARQGDVLGGFNYLLQSGAVYWDAHYSHLATFTCAGHATILSGSSPAVSGIISNFWFDSSLGRRVSCVDDLASDAPAPRTPRNMKVSSVGDELRLATNGQSKVIAIGYKDYAVISLGGRDASLALWFDRGNGNWVSNDYYLSGKGLPDWVTGVNKSGLADRHRSRLWDRFLPRDAYAGTRTDHVLSATREADYGYGWSFPHTPPDGRYSYRSLVATPFANDLLLETALVALEKEELGQDQYPDILALALSSNDYIGHLFGPSSPEVMDTTVRTDRTLSHFLNQLNERIGLDQVTILLTSDHGVQYIPEEVIENRGSGGRLTEEAIRNPIQKDLSQKFGKGEWVLSVEDLDIYLNHQLMEDQDLEAAEVEQVAAEVLAGVSGVLTAFSAFRLKNGPLPPGDLVERVVRTFHPGRSGDVIFIPKPNWFRDADLSTTHGPHYAYNAHVPLILAGKGIRPGQHYRRVDIRDIAPTLSLLLGIGQPSGSSGLVLHEALER